MSGIALDTTTPTLIFNLRNGINAMVALLLFMSGGVSSFAKAAKLQKESSSFLKIFVYKNESYSYDPHLNVDSYFRLKKAEKQGAESKLELEFRFFGEQILQMLKSRQDLIQRYGIVISELEKSIRTTTLVATHDRFQFAKVPRDAINSLKYHLILFNEENWNERDLLEKQVLDLHEFFRFTKINDWDESISSSIIHELSRTWIAPIQEQAHIIDLKSPLVIDPAKDDGKTLALEATINGGESVQIFLQITLKEKNWITIYALIDQKEYYLIPQKMAYRLLEPFRGPVENENKEERQREFNACKSKIEQQQKINSFEVGDRFQIIFSCS